MIGETRTESEIMDAVRGSQLDEAATANPSLTALQVGRGSTDDYLNVFSDEDEKWVRGIPRKMWNYFERSWDSSVTHLTFAVLLSGFGIFGGKVAPEIVELCEAGSFDVAHTRAVDLSSGRDAYAVFVLAMRSAINLTDNFLSEEIDSFTEPEFECAFKVFLFAFQDLMAPNTMLARASATVKRHHNPIVLRSVPKD